LGPSSIDSTASASRAASSPDSAACSASLGRAITALLRPRNAVSSWRLMVRSREGEVLPTTYWSSRGTIRDRSSPRRHVYSTSSFAMCDAIDVDAGARLRASGGARSSRRQRGRASARVRRGLTLEARPRFREQRRDLVRAASDGMARSTPSLLVVLATFQIHASNRAS